MFDQLKQIKKLQEIQSALKNEKIAHDKNGVQVIINGKLEVESVILNPNLSVEEQAKTVKDCLNEAMKKVQGVVAQKMQGMGGFGL